MPAWLRVTMVTAKKLTRPARETGKVVQVMPNYFSIDDPEAHKTIYSHANAWLKGEFYQAFSIGETPDQNNLFAVRDPALHGQMRRKVASMFSMTTLVNYEEYVDECLVLFQKRLHEFATQGTVIDMGLWVQFFAFDVVSSLTVGPPHASSRRLAQSAPPSPPLPLPKRQRQLTRSLDSLASGSGS